MRRCDEMRLAPHSLNVIFLKDTSVANYIKQNKNDVDGWFDAVVNNGILFLNSSVNNLSTSPKSSLIDLYTAIELFFKARLMKEHWSLIISKPESAVKQKFESGDFHSVYLEQAHTRLKKYMW